MKNGSAKHQLEYIKIFKNCVLDDLKSFEVRRMCLFGKIVFSWLFVLIVPFWLFAKSITLSAQHHSIVFLIVFAAMASIYVSSLLLKYVLNAPKIFLRDLKKAHLSKLLKVFGDINWKGSSYKAIIPYDTIRKSELFTVTQEFYWDDQFEGCHCGVNFKVAENNLSATSKSIVLLFDINKRINGKTTVATKWDMTDKHSWVVPLIISLIQIPTIFVFILTENYLMLLLFVSAFVLAAGAYILNLYKKKQKGMLTNKITLEDPEFNKRFIAYSSDEIEGRYLLTTAFMERFQNLKTAFGAKNIKCAFFDDKLMVAIKTNKNLFELGSVSKSLLKTNFAKDFYNEISSILTMVEHFKLDEKTGL